MNKRQVYLDYAAATPIDPSVAKAMEPYWTEKFHNPSAIYSPAKNVKADIDGFRQGIAAAIGVKNSEIIFTAGATEANNLAVYGVIADYPKGHIITTEIEHDSVLEPIKRLASMGAKVTYLKPDEKGIISVREAVSAITEETVLVSIILANNELGTIQPVSKIADELTKLKKQRIKNGNQLPLIFHTDAAQAMNYLETYPKRLGVDLMSFNGSKIYGPKQIGALFINSGVSLSPLILGGGQERGYRSGTENTAYIAGFCAAVKTTAEIRKTEVERLRALQKYFIDRLLNSFERTILNGSVKRRLPNNVHITFEGVDNERLIYELDEMGIFAASGSACSEAADEPSHVLSAIGLSQDQAESSVRFTLGRQTTKEDLDYVIDCLKDILKV